MSSSGGGVGSGGAKLESPKRSALKPRRGSGDAAGAGTGGAGDTSNSGGSFAAAAVDEHPPANDGAEDTITVLAHVREKLIAVHCGFGTQQVAWLGHVAIARYDDTHQQGWLELGAPTAIVKDGSGGTKREALRFTDLICDVLQDGNHVYISTSLE